MDSCPECESDVVYRHVRRTSTSPAGYAYVCVADPEHVYLETDDLLLVG